ncbi:MAG: glycosyltransferase family 4 protein, partial [Clostridia bacterium]|nr:glycosyltransferase family 4 protein [Clostridia bacterium]
MNKALFVATVVKKHINVFHLPFLKMFKTAGYEVHVAAGNDFYNPNECSSPWCDRYYNLSFERSPLKFSNINAYKSIKKLIDAENYDIIHCHTPVGGVVARIAARNARKNGTKVFYTAHGFHFYKGAPLKNWLLYYPIEKLCSKFTDVLITINKEDFALAQRKMKAAEVLYVPGVGIDTEKYENATVDKDAFRKELGIPSDAILLTSVGELNKNKNHEVVLRALSTLDDSNIHYAIAGNGPLHDYLIQLAQELKISNRFHLLGYRRDIAQIYKASDICVFPSIREGLGLAAIEGMAAGLPLIASDNRGTRDYCDNSVNGFLCK